jgi:hypothetical protein
MSKIEKKLSNDFSGRIVLFMLDSSISSKLFFPGPGRIIS